MESSNGDGNSGGPEWPRNVERAGILVGLHPYEGDTAKISMASKSLDKRRHTDPSVDLVHDHDVDSNVRTQDLSFGAIGCNAVNRGE
jgi:hypothetical protein